MESQKHSNNEFLNVLFQKEGDEGGLEDHSLIGILNVISEEFNMPINVVTVLIKFPIH